MRVHSIYLMTKEEGQYRGFQSLNCKIKIKMENAYYAYQMHKRNAKISMINYIGFLRFGLFFHYLKSVFD